MKAAEVVDGLGAPRVARFVLGEFNLGAVTSVERGGKGLPLLLRPATQEDVLTYHQWANDPLVRANAFSKDPIQLENHKKWFSIKLSDPHAGLYVLESEGKLVGQIRFDLIDNRAEIDFSVDPGFRGRGFGVTLLDRGSLAFQKKVAQPVNFFGIVKTSNSSSVKAFTSAGFEHIESKIIGGELCMVFRKVLLGPS